MVHWLGHSDKIEPTHAHAHGLSQLDTSSGKEEHGPGHKGSM